VLGLERVLGLLWVQERVLQQVRVLVQALVLVLVQQWRHRNRRGL